MSDFESRARQAAEAVKRAVEANTPDPERGLGRTRRSTIRTATPGIVATLCLIAGVMVLLPGGGSSTGTGTPYALAGALKPFNQCDQVLQYFKNNAPDRLLAQAKGRGRVIPMEGVGGVPSISPDANALPGASTAENGADQAAPRTPAFSTTNVQEAGVDEPDIVKTDGSRIVAVAQGRAYLIDANGGKPQVRTTIGDTSVRNVFLSGNRLLVFIGDPSVNQGMITRNIPPGGYMPGAMPTNGISQSGMAQQWFGQQSTLSLYDVADIAAPKLVSKLTLDGAVLDARMVGNSVRVVSASSPDVNAPPPTYGPDGNIDAKSQAALRSAVAASKLSDWVPSFTLQNAAGGTVRQGDLVDCANLARPQTFSGIDTVAVTSFDVSSSMDAMKSVGVIAGGQRVYATANSLYVTTTDWTAADQTPATTSLHEFGVAADGASVYRGSGEVPGTLLDQYSMSEYNGVMRVASTLNEQRGWVSQRQVTNNLVTTLKETNGRLRQVGQVGGLGQPDNESIRAVRFIDDKAYVVTARQTDPLYVVDLADAANPSVTGQLDIPGYSGYLNPVGRNLLLGVGQRGQNVQFSLFDVSSPAAPKRIGSQTYGSGDAAAQFDPKAFLYWQPRNMVIAPTSVFGAGSGGSNFDGLVLLSPDKSGLGEIGRLAYVRDTNFGAVNRSFVIGDQVYMLSDVGLQVNDLNTHKEVSILSFGP